MIHTVHCPRCTAQLRRDQPMGALCDPCHKAGHAHVLPGEFFDPEPVRVALATYAFGAFFRQVRRYQTWSQRTLGEVLDLPQAKISAIEKGRELIDVRVIVRIHQRLGVPAALLGFTDRATVSQTTTTGWKGSWMDRRDFLQSTAALALGTAGATELDIERLVALLYPDVHATATPRIGAADVVALESSVLEYERSNATYGGGIARAAAAAQLRTILPLLGAPMDDAVRQRLFIAATHLALLTAWMEFDVEHHDAARRLWTVGLEVARSIDHPLTTDLTAHILFDMAQQSLYLGRPDEAERFVQLGYAAGVGSEPVSASTTTALAINAAFAHAARGRVGDCERALGDAQDAFGRIDFAATPPWWRATCAGPVTITTWQGHAYYELARVSGDARCREHAMSRLAQVVDHPRPMSRALYLPDIAGAYALDGDVHTAVALGHQAVDLATAMSSQRTVARLRVLDSVLKPLHASSGVAELRHRLATAA
ncbi:MAG: helix-turn-helix domain-containing protein [Pseudonocardiaceae bacterium]